jgi:hypothetical protein
MQRKVIRSPYVDRDGDGTTIYRVPLAGTKLEAKILPEDWHRLIEGGASPNWYFNGGGVGFGRKLNGKVRIERPARLILGITDPKVFARFRDRNPLNLRRDNLYAYHVRTQEERDASIPRRSYYRMKG